MDKLDIAVKKYLTGEESRSLIIEIDDPEKLLAPGLLPRDCELINQVEVILDSLNAYNNGLDNSLREEALEAIPPDSPLYPWKNLTLGIKMFYLNKKKEMITYLNEIDPSSPLESLIKHLLNPMESRLYIQNKTLESDLDTLQDAMDAEDEELFEKSLSLIRESISHFNKSDKENIVLTIIEDSIQIFPIETIERSIKGIIDNYTRYRLLALGTIFNSPITSIKYWIESITNCSTEFNRETFDITLGIIRDITVTLIKDGYSLNYQEKSNLKPYLDTLYKELDRIYPREIKVSKNTLTTLKRYLDIKEKKSSSLKKIIRKPVQMELF